MDENFKKELSKCLAKLIKMPNKYENELKDIIIDFDTILEKVSKLPDNLKDESARIFLKLAIKHGLIRL